MGLFEVGMYQIDRQSVLYIIVGLALYHEPESVLTVPYGLEGTVHGFGVITVHVDLVLDEVLVPI